MRPRGQISSESKSLNTSRHASPKPFQFSLRLMLAVVAAFGVLFSFVKEFGEVCMSPREFTYASFQ